MSLDTDIDQNEVNQQIDAHIDHNEANQQPNVE
jgi:hypothetical protein